MSRIDRRFAALKQAGRTGLIPFVTAGDPAGQQSRNFGVVFGRAGSAGQAETRPEHILKFP